ncbi:MAG: thioredoxin [Bacteroidota bacterium]
MNFQQDVIERSFDLPVVVDFWAAWCGPCQVLGPVIEQLAEEQAGRWELVKIDTEAYPEIAEQFKIRGIPNVKLFRDGQAVAEFAGALPKRAIEKWLDEQIPSEDQLALTSILATETIFPDAQTKTNLTQWVEEHPSDQIAKLFLARYLIAEDSQQAQAWSQGFSPVDDHYQLSQAVLQLASFMEADWIEDHPVASKLAEVQTTLRQNNWEEGTQKLIEAVQLDKSYLKDLPRKTTIALFHLLGDSHPISKNYRWRFDMALY